MLLRSGYEGQTITFFSDSRASLAALNKLTIKSDTVEKCLTSLNELGVKNKIHLRWVKAHVGIHGNEIADYLAKKGTLLGEGPTDELLTPKVNQKREIAKYFNKQWAKAWETYAQARQTKIWFPKPDPKKSHQLLQMMRKNLGRLVQFFTGHNRLKRHKNLQQGIINPYSCRLFLEKEESSFHVIAECPALQSIRSEVFELPAPSNLPNPPDWTLSQVTRFLSDSKVDHMLDHSLTQN